MASSLVSRPITSTADVLFRLAHDVCSMHPVLRRTISAVLPALAMVGMLARDISRSSQYMASRSLSILCRSGTLHSTEFRILAARLAVVGLKANGVLTLVLLHW